MQDTKRIWVWVGVAVVVIAVIAAFIWKPSAKAPTVVAPPVTYASAGQIVPQFPQQLIIGSTSTVSSSYLIDYSSSTKQSTVVFNSTSSMQNLYTSYLEYFLDNNWTITNYITKYAGSRGIQAEDSFASVSVAIASKGKGSQATVTFVTK